MIDIIYEHKNWLVIDKPAGVNFHTEGNELGVIAQLESQLSTKLWPVHRLDKLTSGLLLIARDKESCAQLSDLFSKRKVEKFYLAICQSSLKKKQGLIKGDMASARRGAYKLLKSTDNPAITQFFSTSITSGYRLCLLKPKTGKTHQLRVALKSLSAPIVGDTLYTGEPFKRMLLHNFGLCFDYEGEHIAITHMPNFLPDFDVEACLKRENWLQPWDFKWPIL